MRDGQASRTAEHNALFRALESDRPEHRRLFSDPLARAFLRWPYAMATGVARVPGLRRLVPRFIDRRWPGVRTSVVARTRLIDDVIAASLGEHIEQLVILGAGFDSRAYRLRGLADITVFEVDHPDTQAANAGRCDESFPSSRRMFGSSPSTSINASSTRSCPRRAIATQRARSFSGKASRTT
jgi:methyltransferase (TIGR00027 family)